MDEAQFFAVADELAHEAGVESGLHHYFQQHKDRLWTTGSHFQLWDLSGRAVLEIGPFFSYVPFVLQQHGNAVTVLEGADTAVDPLKPLYAKRGIAVTYTDLLEVFRGQETDRPRLPFADQQFDLVNCWETMEHFNFNPVGFVKELHRMLKPGGAAYIAVPNLAKLDSRIKLALGRTIRTPIEDYYRHYGYDGGRFLGFHWREYILSELVELFARQRFAVESAAHLLAYQNTPEVGRGRQLRRHLGRMLCAFIPSCGSICAIVARKPA